MLKGKLYEMMVTNPKKATTNNDKKNLKIDDNSQYIFDCKI